MFDLSNLYEEGGEDTSVITATELELRLCEHLLKRVGGAKSGQEAAGFAEAYLRVNEVIFERSRYLQGETYWEEEEGEF